MFDWDSAAVLPFPTELLCCQWDEDMDGTAISFSTPCVTILLGLHEAIFGRGVVAMGMKSSDLVDSAFRNWMRCAASCLDVLRPIWIWAVRLLLAFSRMKYIHGSNPPSASSIYFFFFGWRFSQGRNCINDTLDRNIKVKIYTQDHSIHSPFCTLALP